MFKRSQIGRSMIEMLGVLAIIGVLSVGGLAGYSKAMNKAKLNDIMAYVDLVKMAIHERELTNAFTTGPVKHKCVDLTGIELPRGMDRCQYTDSRDAPPNRLFIRFEAGDLLPEFGKQVKADQTGVTDERLRSGTLSWYGVRNAGKWLSWSSYYNYGNDYLD